MTVTTMTDQLFAAAELRRLAAEAERHEHGDTAFMRFRSTVPGVDPAAWRRGARTPRELRAKTEVRGGKDVVHTEGYYTRYGRQYPMWDSFGKYREQVRAGAGAKSLARKPEVAFLTNHAGMAMARTTSGSLELREDAEGGWHDGYLNPKRSDVSDLVIAIDDGDVPQMSFAFMIPDGGGMWSADFVDFEIIEYDIDGGDVSAVNFGANPYTDISARAADVLDELTRLPAGAQREALLRLSGAGLEQRGRETVTLHAAPRAVDPDASPMTRRLQGRTVRTADRMVALATSAGLTVADMVGVRLPWYEVRAGDPGTAGGAEEVESTDVYIFDEIGGSFGVDAETFAKDLNAISTPRIALHINSPGGSVFEALAIHSALLHHPSWITAYVDGIAASAASVIALGSDEIVTMPGAEWMLHDASTMAEGNEADLAKAATKIGRQSANIAEIYAGRMKITPEAAREMMLAETWAFAAESVELGLADRVGEKNPAKTPPADMAERMARSHDLTRFGYHYLGRAKAPTPVALTRTGRQSVTTRAGSTAPPQRMGRSIALIEAEIASEMRT